VSLLEIIEGTTYPHEIRIMGDLLCNQSCGCKAKTADNIEDVRDNYLRRLRNTTNVAQSITNLMLRVSDAEHLEDCFKAIASNAKTNTGFRDMLMCLAPDWDKRRVVGDDFSKVNEEMTVVAGFIGDKDVPKMTFMKKDLLPKELMEDPKPYYIYTLHHLQYYMGYLIVDPDIDNREQEGVQSWLVDLGMILEDLRVRRDLRYSVKRLEFLSNRDMLTGIYNRRGVEQFFGSYYDECRSNGTGLAIIAFDMDDLKKINDTYGHSEGDYSIKLIADGMSAAAGEDEICTRAGGDEFVVLAKNYDADKMNTYIEKVRRYIADKVIEDNKQYDVVVSVGTHLGFPKDDFNKDIQKVLEEYQKIADSAMYEEKKSHKKGRASR
jgi:diguanylate cyclase (GGDEF)-like protein